MIGRTVPPGALELADHDNEAELLWVVAYNARQFHDAEGCPQTVIPSIILAENDFEAGLCVSEIQDVFEDALARIKRDPRYMDVLIPGPIVPWPEESSASAEASA